MTHCCATFIRYWPWWVTLGWLIGYELVALARHRATLSQLVWRGSRRWKWLPWVVIPLTAILIAHFWFGLWGPKVLDVSTLPGATTLGDY